MFTQSNSVYRDKLGSRPTADEIIKGDEVKTVISTRKSVEDNGNHIIGHATTGVSCRQIWKYILKVMKKEGVTSAKHNVYDYKFQGHDGTITTII